MDTSYGKLTILFEEPFWIGVFEHIENGKLSVCKVTFGAEPKDYEVWEFILKNYYQLTFSPTVDVAVKSSTLNPKRRQRDARKQGLQSGIGTKSQQALQLQWEENKQMRKKISRENRDAEKQRQFELQQQKRKEKHKGH